MAGRRYVPDRGDVVWLQFTPQVRHRPALVLSPASYNRRSGLMLCCPITSRVKVYPFEVALEGGQELAGVVLADQVKSLDWKARQGSKKGRASSQVMTETLSKLQTLL